jgi:hypothetical protein
MSVTITAVTALSENSYTTTDFPLADVENKIDDAINQVNLFAEKNIPALSGNPEAKTVSMNRLESTSVKLLITILLRETKKTSLSNSSSTSTASSQSDSVQAGPFGASRGNSTSNATSAAAALNNAANSPLVDMFWRSIEKLKSNDKDWQNAFI